MKSKELCYFCTNGRLSDYRYKGISPVCSKHYYHLYKFGRILNTTVFTPNEFLEKGQYVEMIVRDRKQVEKARVLFDKDFLPIVKKYKWCASRMGTKDNVLRIETKIGGNKTLRLHQLILGKKKGFVIDHINRNPLDNRLENLRHCTNKENSRNSKSEGIYWYKRDGTWQASIMVNGKNLFLGRRKKREEAMKLRLAAEKLYFGDFAPKRIALTA